MKEIERKFLINWLPWFDYKKHSYITQYYLQTDPYEIRIRHQYLKDSPHDNYTITFKIGKGLTREEIELCIGREQFLSLKGLAISGIEKQRYKVYDSLNEVTWEIDWFPENDLYLAEVELKDENQKLTLPDWIGREVTGKKKYTNAKMAKRPKKCKK